MTAEDIYQIAKELTISERNRLADMLRVERPKKLSPRQLRSQEIRRKLIQGGILHPPK